MPPYLSSFFSRSRGNECDQAGLSSTVWEWWFPMAAAGRPRAPWRPADGRRRTTVTAARSGSHGSEGSAESAARVNGPHGAAVRSWRRHSGGREAHGPVARMLLPQASPPPSLFVTSNYLDRPSVNTFTTLTGQLDTGHPDSLDTGQDNSHISHQRLPELVTHGTWFDRSVSIFSHFSHSPMV